MESSKKIIFKNLKPHVADAIKESCYSIDVRLYNIANEVRNIVPSSLEPGVDIAKDLSKIVDKTVKDAIDLGCDLSVIVKGIMIGAFRASPFIHQEAHKTIHILITEIIQSVFKYKGDIKQVTEGLLAAIMIIAGEFKLNAQEAVVIVREDMMSSAQAISPEFAEAIKTALSSSRDA